MTHPSSKFVASTWFRRIGLALCFIVLATAAVGADEPKDTKADEKMADQAAIRSTADTFVTAFNRGDAKAVAALWTENGTLADERGIIFKGRQAIENEYAAFFKAQPGAKIHVGIQSIDFPAPNLAIEDGLATVAVERGAPPTAGRYSVVHVKEDGKWLMASVRESSIPIPSNYDKLRDLEWLVGDWEAKTDDTSLHTEIRWIANKSFLERKYSVEKNGIAFSNGLQIIGWDPATAQIKSWTFDSAGGYGTGLWSPAAEGWSIETAGVLPDGTPTASRDTLIRIPGENQVFGWRSSKRIAGQVALPDTEEIVLDRVSEKK